MHELEQASKQHGEFDILNYGFLCKKKKKKIGFLINEFMDVS